MQDTQVFFVEYVCLVVTVVIIVQVVEIGDRGNF